jgi:DNA-binding MarR family transcriptional regulator
MVSMRSPPLPTLGPALDFMRELWALDHALSVRARKLGSRYGITATQRLVLRIVGQTPGISAGDAARILHVHPSTLTPVLQQLEGRGFIRRAADPLDRRRAILWLTRRGERVDAASASEVDEVVRGALGRLAASEVFHARRVLHAVAEALGEARAAEEPRKRPRRAAKKERAGPVRRLVARGASAGVVRGVVDGAPPSGEAAGSA